MFDKKIPILQDYTFNPDDHMPLFNGITKKQIEDIFADSHYEDEVDYMTMGLGAQENRLCRSWRNCKLTEGEPFVYPLVVSPRNAVWQEWWEKIIEIPKPIKELVAENRGKILLHNTWEAWAPGNFIRIIDIIIRRYPKYNFTPDNFIVACGNNRIQDYQEHIPNFVQTQLYSLHPFRERFEDFHIPEMSRPIMTSDILNDEMYNSVVENIKNKRVRKYHFINLNRLCRLHRLAVFTELFEDRHMGILSNMMFLYDIDFPDSIRNSERNSNYSQYIKEILKKEQSEYTVHFAHFKENYPAIHKKFVDAKLIEQCPFLIPDDFSPFFNPNPDPSMEKFLQSSLNIVNETYAIEHDRRFITEKTWKPILYMQPFVIIGTPGILEYLRSLGFATFSNWIDESYDTIDNPQVRLLFAIRSARKFYRRGPHAIAKDLSEMLEVLIHNRETYIKNYNTYYTDVCTRIAVELNYCNRYYDK